jgi:tRNA nucleotidyltransferase (CCA-adding enzyme)
MPDYIYLLENRLSADQQHALRQLREAAREAEMILFLTGDAVRDLTSGHAVRDLEVAVHGNAIKLKKSLEHLGAAIWGESEASKSLFVCFPGTVRVDVVSTHRLDYTSISKPVYHPASIQEDLRRRDFTVNAMAISLNEGSFGLLMDPLNGAADIEARSLRLVSNYGFLEEPSLLIRATRYIARLGWEMDPKTLTRYENAKGEAVIERLSPEALSRELEQIGHEDDGLKVLRALEAEGWMKYLFAPWTAAKADEERLKSLHDLAVELLVQGVHPDMSAAQMQLLTAKLAPKDLAALKKLMLRPGFVEEWDGLDSMAAKFAKVLLSKENAIPSAGFKLFTSYDPEAVLWLGFTSKDKTVLERYRQFLKEWPEARQRIPHALMQEMRITPELATYKEIVQAIFLELIDGKLTTPEEMRAFLEPHSPPAPPPQVTVKRPRAKRGEAKAKERSYDEDEEADDDLDEDEELDDLGGDDDEIDISMNLPKADIEPEGDDLDADSTEDEADSDAGADDGDDTTPDPPPAKRGKGSAAGKPEASRSKSAKVSAKAPAPSPKAKAAPAAVPANPSAATGKSSAPAPGSRKDGAMSDNAIGKIPGVKPPQSLPGVKPPQPAAAQAMTAKPMVTTSAPGVKPPQPTTTKAGPLKAAAVRAPGVKPPQSTMKPVSKAAKPKASAKAVKQAAKPAAKAVKPAAKGLKKR